MFIFSFFVLIQRNNPSTLRLHSGLKGKIVQKFTGNPPLPKEEIRKNSLFFKEGFSEISTSSFLILSTHFLECELNPFNFEKDK